MALFVAPRCCRIATVSFAHPLGWWQFFAVPYAMRMMTGAMRDPLLALSGVIGITTYESASARLFVQNRPPFPSSLSLFLYFFFLYTLTLDQGFRLRPQ